MYHNAIWTECSLSSMQLLALRQMPANTIIWRRSWRIYIGYEYRNEFNTFLCTRISLSERHSAQISVCRQHCPSLFALGFICRPCRTHPHVAFAGPRAGNSLPLALRLPSTSHNSLEKTSEIISVWTIFLSVTACLLTMLALLYQFVPPTALYRLTYLHYTQRSCWRDCPRNFVTAVGLKIERCPYQPSKICDSMCIRLDTKPHWMDRRAGGIARTISFSACTERWRAIKLFSYTI